MQSTGDVFTHCVAHLIVVGTDEGSKLLRAGLTLKDDNGDSFVISPINGWRDGLHLVGGNDEQVDATGHQRVNLFYLAFIAILTLLGNLIADILYAVVDPRVRIA